MYIGDIIQTAASSTTSRDGESVSCGVRQERCEKCGRRKGLEDEGDRERVALRLA